MLASRKLKAQTRYNSKKTNPILTNYARVIKFSRKRSRSLSNSKSLHFSPIQMQCQRDRENPSLQIRLSPNLTRATHINTAHHEMKDQDRISETNLQTMKWKMLNWHPFQSKLVFRRKASNPRSNRLLSLSCNKWTPWKRPRAKRNRCFLVSLRSRKDFRRAFPSQLCLRSSILRKSLWLKLKRKTHSKHTCKASRRMQLDKSLLLT